MKRVFNTKQKKKNSQKQIKEKKKHYKNQKTNKEKPQERKSRSKTSLHGPTRQSFLERCVFLNCRGRALAAQNLFFSIPLNFHEAMNQHSSLITFQPVLLEVPLSNIFFCTKDTLDWKTSSVPCLANKIMPFATRLLLKLQLFSRFFQQKS